jgi:Protein of unknown function (DUF2865)
MIRRSPRPAPKAPDIASLFPFALSNIAPAPQSGWRATLMAGLGLLALTFCSANAGLAAGIIDVSNDLAPVAADQGGEHPANADGRTPTTHFTWISLDPEGKQQKREESETGVGAPFSLALPGLSVCVRLCDGYYFPVGPLSRADQLPNHEAACSRLCPDAATQLYVQPTGSDRIEDAVSRDGARYSALPAAFRNRTALSKTCACHRQSGLSLSLSDDPTLRNGDSIMTPTGLVVFRGDAGGAHASSDFVALAEASMPREKREVLAAIERVSLPGAPPSENDPAATQPAQTTFAAASYRDGLAKSASKSIHFIGPMISAKN